MEIYKKRDILQIVETLIQANDFVRKAASEDSSSIVDVLCQCQEAAVQIGTYLEKLNGDYAALVSVLESYCENIYQMGESLSDSRQCQKLYKKINKQLIWLQNDIAYHMPNDRKEVVFLPYKASMWDSLESVYLAAREDETCDAYVVPIPYYDKNPDGSLGEMHYEGNEYPDNIEITYYEDYNLEERHPDAIYIHNPYDNCNYVTCVPERYFSSNLRKHTEQLVYIPYFILDEIEPHEQSRIERMKHFCFLPGVIFADKVIVQSEKMRQIYINEFIKEAKANGLQGEYIDRKKLEEKILGLGSPKVDKVLKTGTEESEIPEEWLRVIRKPDGSFKIIILYNTGISALLHSNEQMIRKMKNVFEIFRNNKDEVALLWRPHPLIKQSLSSMRPDLWDIYQNLRDWYQENDIGIYDDTSDLNRAIAISDAYYGDYSSVACLCSKKGMPIMYENANIIESDNCL